MRFDRKLQQVILNSIVWKLSTSPNGPQIQSSQMLSGCNIVCQRQIQPAWDASDHSSITKTAVLSMYDIRAHFTSLLRQCGCVWQTDITTGGFVSRRFTRNRWSLLMFPFSWHIPIWHATSHITDQLRRKHIFLLLCC